MTRIIAGIAGGRRLAVPSGQGTRPTSDRAREGLFASVTAARGTLAGAAVLDLYAGSGAVGLEALSRGARHVLLVEQDARAGTNPSGQLSGPDRVARSTIPSAPGASQPCSASIQSTRATSASASA